MKNIEQYLEKNFLNETDNIYINRAEERTRENCVYHMHDFVEICYVASGSGFHLVENKELPVYKGDLFILNYDICHTFIKEQASDNLITYNIVIRPSFIETQLLDLSDFSSHTLSCLIQDIGNSDTVSMKLKESIRLNTHEQDDFDKLFDQMYSEYKLKQEGYVSLLKGYFIELIVKIIRCLSIRYHADKTISKNAQTIGNIINYLSLHYSHGFRLEELAINTFISKNYLCKIFKETTGMTISEYMQRLRVEEACKLLTSTDKKVSAISDEVGFCDYKNFNIKFKKIIGMTPSKYRKQSFSDNNERQT